MNFPDLYIRYWCDVTPGTGYNSAARGYLKALAALGLDIAHVKVASTTRDPLDLTRQPSDWLFRYVGGSRAKEPQINIVHAHPRWLGDYWTQGMYNVAVVVWETDRLPEGTFRDSEGAEWTVAKVLNERYQEVWVPLRHTRDLLLAGGVTVPIHVVPHALVERPVLVEQPRDPRLYYIGTWNPRKDPWQLFEAWLSSGLSLTDNAELLMHCSPGTLDPGLIEANGARVQEAFRDGLRRAPGAVPKVLGPSTTWKSPAEIQRIHQEGTCFVTASHGEGFCLPLVDAAAHGNWIIAGGPWAEELAEVAGSVENGGLVDLLPTTLVPIASMPEIWGFEVGHQWWQVDRAELKDAMLAAAVVPMTPNKEAAAEVQKKYSPRAVGEVLRGRLEEIKEKL